MKSTTFPVAVSGKKIEILGGGWSGGRGKETSLGCNGIRGHIAITGRY